MPDIKKLAEELGVDPNDPNLKHKVCILTLRMSVHMIEAIATGNVSNQNEVAQQIFLSVIDAYINHPEWEKYIPDANVARINYLARHASK